MKLKRVVSVMLLASPILLSGCGGSSSSSPKVENGVIAVSPSLGKISLASVRLLQSDGVTLLGTSETGTDGKVNINYSGSYKGPIIVEVSGDDDASYYDEASGTNIAFGTGKKLRSIVASGTTETAVTMLTEIAYQLSVVNSIPLTNTSVNQINERVRAALAPELTNITIPPLLFDIDTSSGDLGDDQAGKYALRLAALADLGASDATPALTIAEQLARDFSDGALDGQEGSTPITGVLYSPATFAADLTTKLGSFASNYGSVALQTALSSYSAITTSVDVDDLIPDVNGGTLPSYVSGKIVTMKYWSSTSGSPYVMDEEVLFSFSSSGSLMLTDQYTVVATSFTVSGSEYIWVDSANSIQYVLSVNNDAIHEVNVQSIGGSTFYGQFTPVEDTGGETLEPVGDGAALSGGNGATGTIGLNTYTYTGHPTEDSVLYTYSPLTDSGVFIVNNGTDVITRWQLSGFTNSVGRIYCDSEEAIPAIMLTISGSPYLASECVIDVLSISSTEIEGRFAATFTELGTVTNGYFRYEEPEVTNPGGLADGEYGYSMDVDGVNVTDNDVPALDGFDRQVDDFLTLGDTPTFQIRMIPEGVSGTYSCGQGPNAFRLVGMSYQGFTTDNSTYPGSCSIDVSYSDEIYSGTFNGTLYNAQGDEMVITNGILRNDGSQLNDNSSGGSTTQPVLDVNDSTFQSNADTALASYGATSGSGAIYMDIQDNDSDGGDHYLTEKFTLSQVSVSTINNQLVFKSGSFMSNTIGFKSILNQTSGDIDCTDTVDDIGTSEYDVFGYKAYIAPNTLKPYDNNSCQFNVQYNTVDDSYIGQGSAKVHYYHNGASRYYIRDLRFKFVYKP
jgi:hypothetical protein